MRILFSSAGRRVELINCFRSASKGLGYNLEIVAIDMAPEWSPACQVADLSYKVTKCTDKDYVRIVLEICQEEQIDLIVPTIDTELLIYAENRDKFFNKGTDILVSDLNFVHIARDKEKTAKLLRQHGIPSPMTWNLWDCVKSGENIPYPIILKPRDGSCSNGIEIVQSKQKLLKTDISDRSIVAQELCQGEEFTINTFYNREGRCVTCVPHYRKMVRAGEVCFAETVRIDKFKSIAQKFSDIFTGIWGPICFQGFRDENGEVKVFEINARFGGGYPVCDRAGGTFAKWILQDLSGQVPDYNDDWKEGVRMLRYDAAVFIES